jgi:hypothetical protein
MTDKDIEFYFNRHGDVMKIYTVYAYIVNFEICNG